MKEAKTAHSVPVVSIILFLLGVGGVLNFVIPPFQNPDEPVHFGAIMTYALGEEKNEDIQAEIIRMMDENNWWKYVGMGRPEDSPGSLSQIGYLMDYHSAKDYRYKLNKLVLYHAALGKVCGLFFRDNVHSAYYFCRLVSFLFFLGSICTIFLAFQKISSSPNNFFVYCVFIALLFPQYLIISISVNSDAFSIFLGSIFFFSAIGMMFDKIKAHYVVLILLSVGIAFFTKKSIFSLIIMAGLIPFFLMTKKNYKHIIVLCLGMVLVAMLGVILIVNLFPNQFENSVLLVKKFFINNISKFPQIFSLNEFNRSFFLLLIDSVLFKFGWMAYGAHTVFYYVWRIFILASGVGVLVYLGRIAAERIQKIQSKDKQAMMLRMTFFSLAAILVQISGLWVFYGTAKIFVQGRYLFPVMIPVVFLFVLGIKTFFDLIYERGGSIALGSFLICVFFFFSLVVWNYIVPVFHMTIKAPHPGI